MGSNSGNKFLVDAANIVFDLVHRKKIKFNIGKYDFAVNNGKKRYNNQELAKRRAGFIKRETLNNLPELLEQFEKNISSRGAEVFWASDVKQVLSKIEEIVKNENVSSVVKSKSMTTEEIDLNEYFETIGVEPYETDLGEFIVQLEGEKPYHIVTPAMHKSKEDIDALFHRKFNTKEGSTPEELTLFVREYLRQKFCTSELGVTGANFLIADTGSIALTENEGNGLLSMSFPKIHIVIAGIEKIIPSINHLGLFWPLLSSLGTGQQITVYNSIISGPKQQNEVDGPEKMYVILLDNGRTNLYAQKELYQALSCIRCGACLNACPIYKNIGGYTYATTYSGPIGSLITPHFKGIKEFKHLSFASSLCGKCSEVCPVKIPIHNLLLENRRISVEKKYSSSIENFIASSSTFVLSNSKLIDFVNGNVKSFILKPLFKKMTDNMKEIPELPKKSFREEWKKIK
ncbi:MAG: lactate utilization protein [Marinilabiliaceae bacterium]|nr:lactate utilization protein [Marinilabiliaceae bacterium]